MVVAIETLTSSLNSCVNNYKIEQTKNRKNMPPFIDSTLFRSFLAMEKYKKLSRTAFTHLYVATALDGTVNTKNNQVTLKNFATATWRVANSFIHNMGYHDKYNDLDKVISYAAYSLRKDEAELFYSLIGSRFKPWAGPIVLHTHVLAAINKVGPVAYLDSRVAGKHVIHRGTAHVGNSLNNRRANIKLGTPEENILSGTAEMHENNAKGLFHGNLNHKNISLERQAEIAEEMAAELRAKIGK